MFDRTATRPTAPGRNPHRTPVHDPPQRCLWGGMNGSNGDFRMYGTRNQYRQPNTSVFDLKLSKLIRYKERYSLELSGEAFNLFNHQNVTSVNTTGYFVGNCTAASVPACAG